MHKKTILTSLIALMVLVTACGGQGGGSLPIIGGAQHVTVDVVYGSEKTEWLEPLIKLYNGQNNKTASGKIIDVKGNAMGSIESVEQIIAGTIKPTVWSPASSIYIPVANAEWRKANSADLVTGKPNDLVLSPVVIAMWKSMAEALGWPGKPIGWADIGTFAGSGKAWDAYGHPEWGTFKFGHTHPGFSNSGVAAILAMAYAAAGKQRNLSVADVNDPKVHDFMSQVESGIVHYGASTGFFGDRMFERGPSYLSAAVLYENLVVAQENKRLTGASSQPPVVAIYPKEGTFYANHPYVVLDAPWVTAEQKEAAKAFEAFLLAKPQQESALQLGFRPADPAVALAAPLDANHGVDIAQPKTLLDVPPVDAIEATQAQWRTTKKPVDVVLVLDISGSMRGAKIASAKASLKQFLDRLEGIDRVQFMIFNSQISMVSELSQLSDKRDELKSRIDGIVEGGDTSLYDAALQAYTDLLHKGDPKRIRSVVFLTDGQDTSSTHTLKDVVSEINRSAGEGASSIKLFTIAYGSDADKSILTQLAEPTGGREYDSGPQNVNAIYSDIATFF